MIFKPELAQKILSGEKTQARRLVQRERHGMGERGHGIEEVMAVLCPLDGEIEGDLYDNWQGDGVYVWEWDYPQDTWQGPEDFDAWIVRAKWLIGHTYAIQPGRGKKAIGRFRLLSIKRERLQDISALDAEAEGIEMAFDSGGVTPWGTGIDLPNENWKDDFAHLWDSINKPGTRYQDNPEVWVLEFEVA